MIFVIMYTIFAITALAIVMAMASCYQRVSDVQVFGFVISFVWVLVVSFFSFMEIGLSMILAGFLSLSLTILIPYLISKPLIFLRLV